MSKMNFVDDINKLAGKRLRDLGIESDLDGKDNLVEFLQYHTLWIPKIPREVHISKQLNESQKFKQYEKAIAFIREKIEKGEDIMPFASARKKPSKKGGNPYNDDLLNDWGIHHLHLGTEYDKNGKIKRSDDLLFCIINSKSVYFIDIQRHSNDDKDKYNWTNTELLEIVYDNWSELLEPYDIGKFGVIKPFRVHNSSDIYALRKSNLNTVVTLSNGKSFMSIGGGFATDGTSMNVVLCKNAIIKELKRIEKIFQTNQQIISELSNYYEIKLVDFEMDMMKLLYLFFKVGNGKSILVKQTIDNRLKIDIK